MPTNKDANISAKSKVLRTENELDAYVHGPKFDPEHFEQLADAARTARGEFLDLLSDLRPDLK